MELWASTGEEPDGSGGEAASTLPLEECRDVVGDATGESPMSLLDGWRRMAEEEEEEDVVVDFLGMLTSIFSSR
jgi:hypothetical protein